MGQLTESARQDLVSQGMVTGTIAALTSLGFLLEGIAVVVRANDILHFTSLIYLVVIQLLCGISSITVVFFVWWTIAGYRSRQLDIRSKYLDENLTKGLLALLFLVLFNYSVLFISAGFLIVKMETTSRYEMKKAMNSYVTCKKKKVFIDQLQSILQCCGSQSIMDWFSIDWQDANLKTREESSTFNLSISWDSVPFSCCRPETPPPCIHQRLRIFGVASLYGTGCAEKLDKIVLVFVLMTLVMSFILSMALSVLLYSSRKLQTSARSAIDTGDASAPGTWWIFVSQRSSDRKTNEEKPLLERVDAEDSCRQEDVIPADFRPSLHRNPENRMVFYQKSKIIDSTVNEDRRICDSAISQPEYVFSKDWPTRLIHEASSSLSVCSIASKSLHCNCSSDSRRSMSDTAVANMEVSQHFEHKVQPLRNGYMKQ